MCTMIRDMMVESVKAKRALTGALAVFGVLLVSACAQPKPEPADIPVITSPEQARSAPTQPAVRQEEPEAAKPAKTGTAAKQPAPAEQPADTVIYSAQELVGKSQAEVTALIGAPAQVQQRAASMVWTYRSAECGLDIFFFLDMASSDERVLTVESTADTAGEAATATAATADGAAAGTAAAQATDAADGAAAQTPAAGAAGASAVDLCYGKLRRS